jgi:hypothetical protein
LVVKPFVSRPYPEISSTHSEVKFRRKEPDFKAKGHKILYTAEIFVSE